MVLIKLRGTLEVPCLGTGLWLSGLPSICLSDQVVVEGSRTRAQSLSALGVLRV